MANVYDIPFVPSSDDRLETMVQLADISSPCLSIDLGCGDGRVVQAFAEKGALAHGVEIDVQRSALACQNLYNAHLLGRAFIVCDSIWDTVLSPFDVITIYGITGMMGKLEQKLKTEMKPGAKFISNGFMLPHWQPTISENSVHLYLR